MRAPDEYESFKVDTATHVLGALGSGLRPLWIRLARLETDFLREHLEKVALERPVLIAGLARAGSTILLEYLARHDGVATHRYRDYPFVFTPYWWSRFLEGAKRREAAPSQRAHRDGIVVTAESPEAMEEMLWMAFFAQAHEPLQSSVLDEGVRNEKFERFYRDHVRKLLLLRAGSRYVSKNNYNVTRLEYLQQLFPDSRIVIPVRGPQSHVASLVKQHRLFCEGERRHRRALDYMRRVGHFEFGLDFRPVNTGDTASAQSIIDLMHAGDEVRAFARSWADVYGHVAETLARSARLRSSATIVRFEDLCESPAKVLGALSSHCDLSISPDKARAFAATVRYPSYYRADFTSKDLDVIREETDGVAGRLGYEI